MSVTALPAPGVEVIQVFQTVSPTAQKPTLVPCIVGTCKQVVDAVIQSATGGNEVNAEALVTLPAFLVSLPGTGGPPLVYTLNGNFIFQSSSLPAVTVNFASGNYTNSQVVTAVAKALAAVGETDLIPEVYGNTWRLRSATSGDFSTITVLSTSTSGVLAAFGFYSGQYVQGASAYEQYQVTIPTFEFPNPNNNLAELVFENATERGFLGVSGGISLYEALQTSTVLRKGGAVTVTDSGNGTGFSPLITMSGQDFTTATPATVAVVTGASAPDLTGNLDSKTIIMSDGRVPVTVTLPTVCTTLLEIENAINAAFNPLDGIVASTSGSFLRLTSTRLREDGLTTADGEDSTIVILGGSAVYPTNYLDTNVTPNIKIGRTVGSPLAVSPGDQLFVDGVLLGTIIQVAPNGLLTTLKINANKPLAFTGTHFYIQAMNLVPGTVTAARPRPDLTLDSLGDMTFKHGILRDQNGVIVESVQTMALIEPKAGMYVQYRALRLDVTQAATNPGLLTFSDPVTLSQQLSPISPDNPLGLGLFFALLNAPAVQLVGLGVDEISASEPFGTVAGYERAASFLEQFEVYAIAPLTHETTVGQVFQTHVDTMSGPELKGERICLFNPSRPTNYRNVLIASGTSGNSVGGSGLLFDTGISNLAQLMIQQGLTPSSIPVSANVFMSIAANTLNYNISAVSGSVVTINTTFTGSQNTDGFYATSAQPNPLIDEPFSIDVRGAALVLTDGITPDKTNIALTYALLGQSFIDRRFWQFVPDTCAALINGIEQVIDGFYLCAATAGMIGQQPPQQSFTNFPITGFTRAIGSNDFFTPSQLNTMAGGGCYIVVQEVAGGPLFSRMAITTDTTSVETRTDSITKIVDFCAKFYRAALKNFIGRFNINQGFLDSLSHLLQGLSVYLTENGVLIGATVNNIIQDTTTPDTVLIDMTLDVPFPCNYIRLTLVI